MRPLIFLDIDGVCNTPLSQAEWYVDERDVLHRCFAPEPCRQLGRVITATNAAIVISSTWRWSYTPVWISSLIREHAYTPIDVIGVTTHADIPIGFGESVPRGEEIKAWLDWTGYAGKYVILDDDNDMVDLLPRLVQTDSSIGLTEKDADRAIKMLCE